MIHEQIELYEDRSDVTLTTYLIENIDEFPQARRRPAVIINPGGGYLYTSKREGEPIALAFNAMGFHAFVLDYSTYFGKSKHIHFKKPLKPKEETLYPAPLKDLVRAVELIHAHVDEWEIKEEAIGLCGFSAGGHNVAMFGTHWHREEITRMTSLSKEQLEPAFMILAYALLDLESAYQHAHALGERAGLEVLENLLTVTLGKTDVTVEELRDLSPIHRVDAATPPTFLWTTAEDQLVSAQDTLKMATALAEAERPYEVHVYEKGMHGLATARSVSATATRHLNQEAATWLPLAEAWLNLRFEPQFPIHR